MTIDKADGVLANKTGGKFPANIMPDRGNSDMPLVPGQGIPVVPKLPVASRFAPDGGDAWDGDAEAVDLNNDGYETGMASDLRAANSHVWSSRWFR